MVVRFSVILIASTQLFSALAYAEPTIWVHDSRRNLATVDLSTNEVEIKGTMPQSMTDIAHDLSGSLFGMTNTNLYEINESDLSTRLIGRHGILGGNALVFGSDGTLYAAGSSSTELFTIDPITGESTAIGNTGFRSAGDLAFNGVRLFMSSTTHELVELSLDGETSGTVVGPFGVSNVWGLSTVDNGQLYGVAGTSLYKVSSFTGATDFVGDLSLGGLSTIRGSSLKPFKDSDGDGLPDYWENRFGLNPFDESDVDDDLDVDGLDNQNEFAAGTNPTLVDTDGDGVNDYDETLQGSDPLDVMESTGVPDVNLATTTSLYLARIDDFGDTEFVLLDSSLCTDPQSRPTIVLTHGVSPEAALESAPKELWTGYSSDAETPVPDESKGAPHLIQRSKQATLGPDLNAIDANIFVFVWDGAFKVNYLIDRLEYFRAYVNYEPAGQRLASELTSCLGLSYSESLHFVGHSMGTAVNAVAARRTLMNLADVSEAQVTVLDRPDRIQKILGSPSVAKLVAKSEAEVTFMNRYNTQGNQFEGSYGFGEIYLARQLDALREPCQAGESLNCIRIDNYYAQPGSIIDGAGVGDRSYGEAVYNHREDGLVNANDVGDALFKNEELFRVIDNDHSGIHQWYRWSISPNDEILLADKNLSLPCNEATDIFTPPDGFDLSLDPCTSGWYWSLNGPNPGAWPGPNAEVLTAIDFDEQDPIFDTGAATGFGFEIRTSTPDGSPTFVLTEQSSPHVIVPVTFGGRADFISFDYTLTAAGDGDYVAVYIDNDVIWTASTDNMEVGVTDNSGPIPLDVAAGDHKLSIGLFGVGAKNAIFEVANIKFETVIETSVSPPPPPPPPTPTPPPSGGSSSKSGGGALDFISLMFVLVFTFVAESARYRVRGRAANGSTTG